MEIILTVLVIAVVVLYFRINNLKTTDNPNSSIEDVTGRLRQEAESTEARVRKEIEKIQNEVLQTKISVSTVEGKVNTIIEERKIESAMSKQPIEKSVTFEKVPESSVNSIQPFQDPSKRIQKWLLIRCGMQMNMVKDILGNPDRISQIGDKPYWYYEDGTLQFSKTSTTVILYNYEFGGHEQDLSRWEEIKKGMTKSKAVSVLGNPYSVEVEMNYEDTRESWNYFDKEHMAVINFDHVSKIYEFWKKTKAQVDADGEAVRKELGM